MLDCIRAPANPMYPPSQESKTVSHWVCSSNTSRSSSTPADSCFGSISQEVVPMMYLIVFPNSKSLVGCGSQALPDTLHVLEQTPLVKSLHTIIRDSAVVCCYYSAQTIESFLIVLVQHRRASPSSSMQTDSRAFWWRAPCRTCPTTATLSSHPQASPLLHKHQAHRLG